MKGLSGGLYRQVSLLLCALAFSLISCYAQVTDGLLVGDNVSTFEDMLISHSAASTKQYLHMESLWEMDMSKASDGDAVDDAFQNNHNLFIIDDIIYVYVEKYNIPGERITLRRFDTATGSYLPDLHADFSEELANTALQRFVMADQRGHIAMIGLNANPITNYINLYIQVYDSDLNFIKTISYLSGEKEKSDRFLPNFEWLGLTGDLMSGNFNLAIGCWHAWGNAWGNVYYPSRCEFDFSKAATEPAINITRYDSDKYVFESRSDTPAQKPWIGMLFSTKIDDDYHLVQGFGTNANPDTHSPVLLYKDNGERHSLSAKEPYLMLNQTDVLSDKNLTYHDTGCFGAFPVNVGDEKLMILPYERNEASGIVFKLARWTDSSSFSSLSSLWQFPDNETKYPCPIKYQTLRPKVVTISSGSTSRQADTNLAPNEQDASSSPTATFYAYMPGSFLGAYKVSVVDDPIASGITLFTDGTHRDYSYHMSGRTLKLISRSSVDLKVYGTDGRLVYSSWIPAETSEIINLDFLQSGMYLISINGRCDKFELR